MRGTNTVGDELPVFVTSGVADACGFVLVVGCDLFLSVWTTVGCSRGFGGGLIGLLETCPKAETVELTHNTKAATLSRTALFLVKLLIFLLFEDAVGFPLYSEGYPK